MSRRVGTGPQAVAERHLTRGRRIAREHDAATFSDARRRVRAFADSLRPGLTDRRHHEVLGSLAEVQTRLELLELVLARYRASAKAYENAAARTLTEFRAGRLDAARVADSFRPAGRAFHLDLESFFVFARILVDRLASMVAWTYAPEEASKVDRHAALTSRNRKGRVVALFRNNHPLTALIDEIDERLGTVRNDPIVHRGDPTTVVAFTYDGREPTVVYSPNLPAESLKASGPNELAELLSRYIEALMDHCEGQGHAIPGWEPDSR